MSKGEALKSIVEGDKTADEISRAVKLALNTLGDVGLADEELDKLCDEAVSEKVSSRNEIRRQRSLPA